MNQFEVILLSLLSIYFIIQSITSLIFVVNRVRVNDIEERLRSNNMIYSDNVNSFSTRIVNLEKEINENLCYISELKKQNIELTYLLAKKFSKEDYNNLVLRIDENGSTNYHVVKEEPCPEN